MSIDDDLGVRVATYDTADRVYVGRCVIRTAPWASFTWKAWCNYDTCDSAWIALTTSRATAEAAAWAHIHGDLPGGAI